MKEDKNQWRVSKEYPVTILAPANLTQLIKLTVIADVPTAEQIKIGQKLCDRLNA